ncbi:MAG: hypothetical protein ACRD2B_04515 [Terriglobia bacterium]
MRDWVRHYHEVEAESDRRDLEMLHRQAEAWQKKIQQSKNRPSAQAPEREPSAQPAKVPALTHSSS